MSPKMRVLLTILAIFGICLPVGGQPWDGGGVEGDPYLIYTTEDMQAVGADPNYRDAHFKLMADIDLVAYTGTSFNIIGNEAVKAFIGVFEGNGHTISNFSYTCTDVNCIGLFGYVYQGGEIKNLGLLNADIDAGAGDDVGSLVGWNSGTVSNCYATGVVMGGDNVGGLTGRNFDRVSNCYAMVDVTGYDNVGGLAGLNVFDTISNCYATGAVAGYDNVGGFVGYNFGNISVSFWDTETSGEPNGVGSGSAAGVTGKTTAEMQMMSTFLGWGSEPAMWTIDEGNDYPHLAWESQTGEPISPVLSDLLAGAGTESEPYLIYTDDELNLIGLFSCEWDKHVKLMADIDLSGFTGTEFNTIGTNYKNAFTGSFDGNGHTISNFTYTTTDRNYIGLFREVGSDGEIKGLSLLNVNVNPSVGFANNVVGSLVGHNSGTVSTCSATGFVTGTLNVSGLIGGNSGMVSNCSAAVTVTGDDRVGGLVGYNYGTISDCYATGSVTGGEYIGGLVGRNYDTVSNCYAAGSVAGTMDVGGLVGYGHEDSYVKCFWDSTVNPLLSGIGNGSDPDVIGETTSNMQTAGTFTSAGWDFINERSNGIEDIWRLCNEGAEYPQLQWGYGLGDIVCGDGVDGYDLGAVCEQWLFEEIPDDLAPDGGDGVVNFLDWAVFAEGWQIAEDYDSLAGFAEQWLKTGSNYLNADIAPAPVGDKIVNMLDFAVLADNWLTGN